MHILIRHLGAADSPWGTAEIFRLRWTVHTPKMTTVVTSQKQKRELELQINQQRVKSGWKLI